VSDTLPPLSPRLVSRALLEPLDYEPVEPGKVVDGSPTTGLLELGVWQGVEVGVWEMTPGSMVDTEVEEMFVVIAGEATLTRHLDGVEEVVTLSPGVVCHLEEGEHNRWDVRVALRKIYFAPS
jgi:uncharacterized cupin superfamily protein